MAAAIAGAHGNNKVSVPAKTSFITCGVRMMYSNGGYGCKQEAKRVKAKKADNYKLKFTKIPRR